MNLSRIAAGVVLVALMALGGCTSIETQQEQPPAEQPAADPNAAGASSSGVQLDNSMGGSAMPITSPLAGGSSGSSDSLTDPNSPLANRIFYFPYDSATLSDLDRDIVAAHGRYLAAHPNQRLTVEGHTDERGSREYNLALGERRAAAVEQILTLQGANKSQIQVVSFGEERPVDFGHDESAWGQNRRAELIYAGR